MMDINTFWFYVIYIVHSCPLWRTPKSLISPKLGLSYSSREIVGGGLGARSQLSALKGVEGHAQAPGWD
jgi:hypothetical protein